MKPRNDNFKESYRHFANKIVIATSSHLAFTLFFSVIIIWLCVGFWVGFTESWQLILHITLAIVTFLMVLLIQHIQLRETRSMQIKLDELLKGVEGSRNAFINIQAKPDDHLDKLQNEFDNIEANAQDGINKAELNGESANESASNAPVKIKTFRMSE